MAAAVPAGPLEGQQSKETYQVRAVRVDQGPNIDGVLDDAIWVRAPLVDQFVQQEPDEGAPATERTEVRILYDGGNLYLAVRAFDSDPDGIIATEMRRDSPRILDEDNFQVVLDTFNDSRSAYMFVTTPLGARLEQQIFEEGEGRTIGLSANINRDWNGVWHVATQRTDEGWTAEIAIPMVTLRFPDATRQDWGLNFMRNIRRKNEQAFWAQIPKAYTVTRVSLAGSLRDLESLERGRDLRIKPFVVGGGRRLSEGGVADDTRQGDMGLDVKYGVTPSLNLDLTLNTDFAQAEVDDEQINLTRFALFFPEKREFFLENAGQFNVGTTNTFERIADLFFSRRIGLSETGEAIPILGGARLTGKVGRNNVAVMDIQTEEAFGRSGDNFFVARYSRDVLARSKVGGIVINREGTGAGGSYNRTFAADFVLAPHPKVSMNGFIARTVTPGVTDKELGGHFRAEWLNENAQAHLEYSHIEDNFNPEVGFVPRPGIKKTRIHGEWNPRPDRWGIRLLDPMVNVTYTTDLDNRLVSRRVHYMLGATFQNGARAMVWYNDHFERLDDPFTVAGVVIPVGDYNFGQWMLWLTSDPSRKLYADLRLQPQTWFDGDRTDVTLTLGLRATDRLSTEGRYTRNDVSLPGGDFVTQLGSLRVDFALSPTMTLRSLSQYNSLTEQWSTSVRFNYIYRPGSDIYLVYDDVRRDPTGLPLIRDRQIQLKVTYLLSR